MSKYTFEFVKAAFRNPLNVSTPFPTSRQLAETMIGFADISSAKSVVELGAGTGAITKYLQSKLPQQSTYLGVELDPKMVNFMRREFPKLKFETGPAESLTNWVTPGTVDVVISSLPWTLFSDQTQARTLNAIFESLKPGGVFLTYVCANAMLSPQARSFLRILRERFSDVHRSELEWRNIPPAFVYRSIK